MSILASHAISPQVRGLAKSLVECLEAARESRSN